MAIPTVIGIAPMMIIIATMPTVGVMLAAMVPPICVMSAAAICVMSATVTAMSAAAACSKLATVTAVAEASAIDIHAAMATMSAAAACSKIATMSATMSAAVTATLTDKRHEPGSGIAF